MIASVADLCACLLVEKKRKLSQTAQPDVAICQLLGLPLPHDATKAQLNTLKPIYEDVLKDIRQNQEKSRFLKPILNSTQEEAGEAIMLFYFLDFPQMTRTSAVSSNSVNDTFQLIDISDEITSSTILGKFSRNAVEKHDTIHASVLASAIGFMSHQNRGRKKKYIKNIIFRGKGYDKGFKQLRKDLANLVSARTDLVFQAVANAILVQRSVLRLVHSTDTDAKVCDIMESASNKEVFDKALLRHTKHIDPNTLQTLRGMLGVQLTAAEVEKARNLPMENLLRHKKEEVRCDNKGCDKAGKLRCISCKLVNYCSRECQKAAWKGGHKKVCKKYSSKETTGQTSFKEDAAAVNKARTRKTPALLHQESYWADNPNFDYVIILPGGNRDNAVIFTDPLTKKMFRHMRDSAVEFPRAVNGMYRLLVEMHPDKEKLLRNQLWTEYGLDPISHEATSGRFPIVPEDELPDSSSDINENDDNAFDATHDGIWLASGPNDSMVCLNDDNFNLLQKEDYEEDISSGLTSSDELQNFILLKADSFIEVIESCVDRNLKVASGLSWRVIRGDSMLPPIVRISRIEEREMEGMITKKKKGNEEFKKHNYKKAIECYELAIMLHFPMRLYIAPSSQMADIVSILSNQAECHLRLKEFREAASVATDALQIDGGHGKTLIRRVKAEIALYKSNIREEGTWVTKDKTLFYLVQACKDLEGALDGENSLANKAAKEMIEEVKPYLEQERTRMDIQKTNISFQLLVDTYRGMCFY